ncbi:MAG: DUF3298 domain-containing protein [Sarcina sp.]
MKKKVFLLLILFCCIFGIQAKASGNSLIIDSKNIISDTQSVDVNIQLPGVKSTDKIALGIFNKIDDDITKWSDKLINEAKADLFDPKYVVNSSFHVPYNANNLLSLNVMNYFYAGGAHGLSTLHAYNYDVKTGKELMLKDFFTDGYDYKTLINNKIKKYMSEDKDTYFSGGQEFKGISDKQEFYLSNQGITVYFQAYDIAPYAAGIRYFLIPKAEMASNLKIKF